MDEIKAIAITNYGFEDICKNDLIEMFNIDESKIEIRDSVVIFTTCIENVLKFAYMGQSIKRVMIFLGEFDFDSIEDIKNNSKFDYVSKISENETFAIRTSFEIKPIFSDKNTSSQEIPRALGYNIPRTVNLGSPDKIIHAHFFKNHCFVGVDLCDIDLSKRYYRIFSHPKCIKGTLAYFMLKIAGYNGEGILVDSMAGSGTIPLEAALIQSKLSHNYYRKTELKFLKMPEYKELGKKIIKELNSDVVDASKKVSIFAYDNQLSSANAIKKNAKIAGVSKYISQGRGEVDWIDTKFEKGSVDFVVTNPPEFTKYLLKDISKTMEQFFHRVKLIVSKKSKIVILTNGKKTISEIASSKGFILESSREFELGGRKKYILVFKKEIKSKMTRSIKSKKPIKSFKSLNSDNKIDDKQ
jgi:23S rRNA (guanine2445-N2)-methyltransferase / 23S rRNA (guanine2069-N7)-methyltransferase